MNVNGSLIIQYSKDDFVSDVQNIALNADNTGSYTWKKVPADYSDKVKVRITSMLNPSVTDESDNYFSIVNGGNCAPAPVITTDYLPSGQEGYNYSFSMSQMSRARAPESGT